MEELPEKIGPDAKASNDAAQMSLTMLYLYAVIEDSYSAQYVATTRQLEVKDKVVIRRSRRQNPWVILTTALIFLSVGIVQGKRLDKPVPKVIATVNSETVTETEVANQARIMAGRTAFQKILNDKVAIQYARSRNLLPTPIQVEYRFNTDIAKPDFFKNLVKANMSLDDYKHQLMIDLCKLNILSVGVTSADYQVQEYYKRNIDPGNRSAKYYHPESVVIAEIATRTEEECRNALFEVRDHVPFYEVARKYSIDDNKWRGGVLPAIQKTMLQDAAFRKYPGFGEMLFDHMQVGDVIGPYKLGPVWLVIQCVNHNPEVTDPFDKVKDDCIASVVSERTGNREAVTKDVTNFVFKSHLSINDERYFDIGMNSGDVTDLPGLDIFAAASSRVKRSVENISVP